MMIGSAQIRGARAMVGWTAGQLASQAGVHRRTIRMIERDLAIPQKKTTRLIVEALSSAGAMFDDNGMVGVKSAKEDAR